VGGYTGRPVTVDQEANDSVRHLDVFGHQIDERGVVDFSSTTSDSAVTSAVRGWESSAANSPNTLPRPSSARVSLPSCTRTRPLAIRYIVDSIFPFSTIRPPVFTETSFASAASSTRTSSSVVKKEFNRFQKQYLLDCR
jgi:hypothetical protein